jgi:hypothetical protein
MITIDEAINELKEEESHLRRQAEQCGAFTMFKGYYLKKAANLSQVAEWLTEYQQMKRG